MKDFYYILGTDVNCTSYEIREAYIKLSKKFRPDLNQNDNYFESRFREIREAYETLIDPDKRSKYDEALRKFKPNPQGEELKKKHYYFISRSVDIAFTTILVLITLMFGDYVIKSISSSKTSNTAIFSNLPFSTTYNHHKKKQILKLKSGGKLNGVVKAIPKSGATIDPLSKPAKIIADTTNVRPIKIVKVNNDSIKGGNKPSVVNAAYHPDYLYEAYINSNVTGLVYMHKLDDYNSAVIKVIPTNSKIFVLAKGNTFYKVMFNSTPGYVPKWTVKTN